MTDSLSDHVLLFLELLAQLEINRIKLIPSLAVVELIKLMHLSPPPGLDWYYRFILFSFHHLFVDQLVSLLEFYYSESFRPSEPTVCQQIIN